MKKTFLKSALLAAATIGMLAGNAMAAQFTGGISLNGFTFKALDAGGGDSGLASADQIKFSTDEFNMTVGSGSGSFELVVDGTPGKIYDFTFDPFAPVTPIWEFTSGGVEYSFDLTYANISQQSSSSLVIDGYGYLNGGDYEPTLGTWTFSSNLAGTATSSWSASTAVVPEPATMLLFGTGLAGLAGVARRKKK